MQRSDYIIILLFIIGLAFIFIPFIYPEKKISEQKTNEFLLDCNTVKRIPIFFQNDTKLFVYLSRSNNSEFEFQIHDPLSNIIEKDKFFYLNSETFRIFIHNNGFYTFDFFIKNCSDEKEKIIFSYILENEDKINTSNLLNIGTIMISFASGYILNIFKNRFNNPFGQSRIENLIPGKTNTSKFKSRKGLIILFIVVLIIVIIVIFFQSLGIINVNYNFFQSLLFQLLGNSTVTNNFPNGQNLEKENLFSNNTSNSFKLIQTESETEELSSVRTTFTPIINITNGASINGNPNYDPKELTIKKDDNIIINNKDLTSHTVTNGNGLMVLKSGNIFNSGILNGGESYRFQISNIAVGKYPYYCTIHPYMSGTLIIQ